MATKPEVKYGGTATHKSLSLNLKFVSYVDDPKVIKVGDNENTNVMELPMGSVLKGIIARLDEQCGYPTRVYYSSKTMTFYFSKDSESDKKDFSDQDF